MSGIEVVGLVLGGFPILLNCLDYYQKGFEPLEEWWNFRTRFVEFIDEVRHQEMRYRENMHRLLDPIIADDRSLTRMMNLLSSDPAWTSRSIQTEIESRLASEIDRFIRIITDMRKVMLDIYKLLKIEDGKISWIGAGSDTKWQWHVQRMRLSFSKKKHAKVGKLAKYNKQLQEILGYSERVLQIPNRKRSSEPVTNLERIREQICRLDSALIGSWKCPRSPHSHNANLGLPTDMMPTKLQLYLAIGNDRNEPISTMQEVLVQPVETNLPQRHSSIGYSQQSMMLAAIQEEEMLQDRSGVSDVLSENFKLQRSPIVVASMETEPQISTKPPARPGSAQLHSPEIVVDSSHVRSIAISDLYKTCSIEPINNSISNLFEFLDSKAENLGAIYDHSTGLVLKISKPLPQPQRLQPKFVTLPELLDALKKSQIRLSEHKRFEMAAQIASALLQIHNSPWLDNKLSKSHFLFPVDAVSNMLCSPSPFISKSFCASAKKGTAPYPHDRGSATDIGSSEEEVRANLFTIGVMILELIFGHNIEDCVFRDNYFGRDNRPTDQTDISTAKKWAKDVLGEFGPSVDDAVRRCLDCSFGPKPNFRDIRFRESVYEGVMRPLAEYKKIWAEVQL
ncbi:hypothetical protein GGR51DRAFT_515004 [Nemania sp. FL0031]|nr:hypothetical protein GGR51DRAFT_515004 [Nemania sp. FL0031]